MSIGITYSSCHNRAEDGAKFCGYCGKQFGGEIKNGKRDHEKKENLFMKEKNYMVQNKCDHG